MGIANYTDSTEPVYDKIVSQSNQDTQLKPRLTSTYDTATTVPSHSPVSSVHKYTTGYSWTVDYYRQILQSNDPLTSIDPNLSAASQQYEGVRDYDLQVTSSLDGSTLSQSGSSVVIGSAIVYGPFIPNEGDVFTGRVLGGRPAIFTVLEVTLQGYDRTRVYEISYRLRGYLDDADGALLLSDVRNKEVTTYHYDKDASSNVSVPVLNTTKKNLKDIIDKLYWGTLEYYMDTFFDKEMMTLLLPVDNTYIYDPWLVKHILSVTNTTDHEYMLKLTTYDVGAKEIYSKDTIWDLLKSRSIRKLNKVTKKISLLPVSSLPRNLVNATIRYTAIDFIVYKEGGMDFTTRVTDSTPSTISTIPDVTNYYVLTSKFYEEASDVTLLEAMVLDYLNDKTISPEKLVELTEVYLTWSDIQQYYYLPIIWMLMRDVRDELYGYK